MFDHKIIAFIAHRHQLARLKDEPVVTVDDRIKAAESERTEGNAHFAAQHFEEARKSYDSGMIGSHLPI